MKYQSTDALEKFRFYDTKIVACKVESNQMELELEGLIVRANHPENQTCADRYADTAVFFLRGGILLSALKEGYKYYDANDVLMQEIPDEEIVPSEYGMLFDQLDKGYIFALDRPEVLREKLSGQFPEQLLQFGEDAAFFEKNGKHLLCMAVDLQEEEADAMQATYWMLFSYEKAVLEWERFLNKPEQYSANLDFVV